MKLAAVSFVAALLAAPLAARAAQPAPRFSLTLTGRVVESVTYESTSVEQECSIGRTGQGGRELTVRSIRPTTVRVVRSRTGGAIYRPAEVAAVRLTTDPMRGGYQEARRCRGEPPRIVQVDCAKRDATVARTRVAFRRAPNRILFRPRSSSAAICGVARPVPLTGWLDLAAGRVSERLLLNGRTRVVRAERTRETTGLRLPSVPNLEYASRVTVSWTLTFRRIR
jgi:hypothetical protein